MKNPGTPYCLEMRADSLSWNEEVSFLSTSTMKRQPSEWEKIIANETTDKGLTSKIYKQLIQLNTRKTNTQSKSGKKDLNRLSSKEDIQMAKKTHEKKLNTAYY